MSAWNVNSEPDTFTLCWTHETQVWIGNANMSDFEKRPQHTASLRVKRLDNGSIRFSIHDERHDQEIAFVTMDRQYARDIASLIYQKLAEPLD